MKKTTLLFVFLLGIMLTTSFAQEKDIAKLTKTAEKGDVKAQIELGKCYYDGKNVEKNYAEALKWFTKAADKGYAEGQYRLGRMYDNGKGVNKNEETAVKLYRQAAQQGYAYAQRALGIAFEIGEGIEKNQDSAKYWYDKAYPQIRKIAESGDMEGEFHLGNCYYFGQGVPQNYEEAVNWDRKAAEQGYAQAQSNLGNWYYNGEGVPQNYEEAVKWYRKAADQGNAQAQLNLGYCYEMGICVPKNYEEAVKWYTKAAEQEYAEAQNNLGWCYYNGKGVKLDYNEALKWYEKAAENGYIDANSAMLDIAYFYSDYFSDENDNFQKVVQKAKSNYMKEVNKGNTSAMIRMGDLYSYYCIDRLHSTNLNNAITWYNLAISQGDPCGIVALANFYDLINLYLMNNSIDVISFDTLPDKKYNEYYERFLKDTYPLWLRAANSGSAEAQAVVGFKCFLEKNFDEAMEWYNKAEKNGANGVYRGVHLRLPLSIAIMLCDYFKIHSSEYDFYFSENYEPVDIGCWEHYYTYEWIIGVFHNDNSSNYSVTVKKNNKYGLIKLSKDGKLLGKTPIIYDSEIRYNEYDETGKFSTTLNGQVVDFDF